MTSRGSANSPVEDTTVDALIEGVDLVERKLLKALTDAGLKVLDPHGGSF